jgi:hypothetical protein
MSGNENGTTKSQQTKRYRAVYNQRSIRVNQAVRDKQQHPVKDSAAKNTAANGKGK